MNEMPRTRLIDKKSLKEMESDSPYADRKAVEAFAAELTVNFLQCRELGHNWRPWTARKDNEHNCFERALRCVRCKTKRVEAISYSGAKLRSHYEYPEKYTANGIGRIVGEGRDALRLESLTRVLVSLADDEAQAS